MSFATFSEAELKQLLDELKAEYLASIRGQRYISVSTGGKSFSRAVRSSDQIKTDLGDVERALQIKNPTVYGSPTSKTYVNGQSFQFK